MSNKPVDVFGEAWKAQFEISDCCPPKFWLGDKVLFGDRIGTVMGIEGRPENMPLVSSTNPCLKPGWWYGCKWERSVSTQWVHEGSLVNFQY